MNYGTPSFPILHISWSLLRLKSIELWCHLTITSSVVPFSFLLQSSPVFSKESIFHIRWPKYWSFSFNISPSNENSGLVSFRTDWFDLLVVHGTLRVFSSMTVRMHQFFSTQPLLFSSSHVRIWLLEKPQLWLGGPLQAKLCLWFLICCLGWS